VPLFDERVGRFTAAKLGDPEGVHANREVIRQLGFNPAEFARRDLNSRDLNCAASALSYVKAEEWLRKRWGTIEIPEREGAINACVQPKTVAPREGVKVYLADGAGLGTGGNFYRAEKGLRIYLAEATRYMRDTASATRAMVARQEEGQ